MSLALQAVVSLDHSAFTSGMTSLSQTVSNITGAMSMAFGGVASEILAMSKAFGPVGAAVATLKNVSTAGMEIGQSLAEVASLTNEGAAAIGKFGQLADTVTQSTKFGMTDVVQAMNMFAAAGYESADVMQNVLKPGLDLAAAGGTSTANAVSVMVSALKTFGLEASQATNVANLFAGGANVSMASVESLGEGMVYAGSVASAYGMKLNETIGVLSLYADKGMQGSVAGTAFAQSMAALTKAANEGKTAIGEALKDWNPATEGMQGAIQRLETSGISATAVLAEFGRQGGKAVASLLNSGSEAIANYTAKVGEVGDAADVAAQRQNTLKGSLADLKGEFERLQFALYAIVKDELTGFIQSTTEATQKIIEFVKTIVAGDWDAAKAQITALWESIKAGAQAFDWMGLFDSMAGILDDLIGRVAAFGETIMQQIGLTQTLDALRGAFETVQEVIGRLLGQAENMAECFRDVKWADVAKAAINALDIALATVIATIEDVIQGVAALIEGWKNLSVEAKAVALAITGTAGLTVGLVQLVATIKAMTTATAALAVAMKANIISHAETAYIKLLLLGDAIKSVTLAQAGMVAGAAALGVGLGTLIRKIPGVADALDNLAVKTGQWLGLVEKEDMALKRNLEELKAKRKAMQEAAAAQKENTVEIEAANLAIGEQVMKQRELGGVMKTVTDAIMPLAPAVREVKKEVEQATGFWDAYQSNSLKANTAIMESIIAMRQFSPVAADMQQVLDTTGISLKSVTDASDEAKYSFQDLWGMIGKFKDLEIDAFDISSFTFSLKLLKESLVDIDLPSIKLPDFSGFELPKITPEQVSKFTNSLRLLVMQMTGLDTITFKMPEIKMPDIDSGKVKSLLASLTELKDGLMNIDFGALGGINVDIKGGGASDAVERLDKILNFMESKNGILWA
jgi:TP901 family phage tail tape measure protein